MEANEAPEKIYIPRLVSDGKLIHEWNDVPFKKFRFFFDKEIAENIEYTRTDAFIERTCEWLKEHVLEYVSEMNYGVGKTQPDYYTMNFIESLKKYMNRL